MPLTWAITIEANEQIKTFGTGDAATQQRLLNEAIDRLTDCGIVAYDLLTTDYRKRAYARAAAWWIMCQALLATSIRLSSVQAGITANAAYEDALYSFRLEIERLGGTHSTLPASGIKTVPSPSLYDSALIQTARSSGAAVDVSELDQERWDDLAEDDVP